GLCAVTYGRRAFAGAAGFAAALKLTAMGVWPFLLVRRSAGKLTRVQAVVIALAVWTVLNPQSWIAGGPIYISAMWTDRYKEWDGQTETYGGPLGAFFPSRYQWPVELAVVLLISLAAEQVVRRLQVRRLRAVATPDATRS